MDSSADGEHNSESKFGDTIKITYKYQVFVLGLINAEWSSLPVTL